MRRRIEKFDRRFFLDQSIERAGDERIAGTKCIDHLRPEGRDFEPIIAMSENCALGAARHQRPLGTSFDHPMRERQRILSRVVFAEADARKQIGAIF